jgi:hypothetical protein
MSDDIDCRVVGVTFCPGYPATVTDLAVMATERLLDTDAMEPIPAVLIRNPANQYDGNAVEVHVPALGQQIGHLPRDVAATVAPLLDAGDRWLADVYEVVIHPEHPERPGIALLLRRVPASGGGSE